MIKKIIYGLIVFATIITYSTTSVFKSKEVVDLTLADIESIADSGESSACAGFKRELKYIEGANRACCVNGTYMDGCVFALEDSRCNQYIVRNPKPSGC